MTRNISSHPVRRTPQRTCVACREIKTKPELIRLVRTPEGNIEVDISARMKGRGAYLCPASVCWEAGVKGGRLEHHLKTRLNEENREKLITFGKGFLKEHMSDRDKAAR